MKRIHFAIILLTFIGLVFAGCTDKVQSPTAASDNTLPSLSKTEGPGAWIIKSASEFEIDFYDPTTHLDLILGINNMKDYSNGDGGLDSMNATVVVLPILQDSTLMRAFFRATNDSMDARVYYCRTEPTSDDIESLLNDDLPIASGYVNFSLVDNDYPMGGHINKIVFQVMANGTLAGKDKSYQLASFLRIVANSDFTFFSERVKVQLSPSYIPLL